MPKNYKKNNKKKYQKRKRSDTRVKTLAKQAVNSMKPMKKLAVDAVNQQYDLSSNSWIMIQPYFIGGGPNNSGSAENTRLSNQVWHHRTSGIHWIRIPPTCLYPVEVRKMCGWFKGSSDATDASINSFSALALTSSFPNRTRRYDSDNFKIIEDKSWTVMPHQIFDNTSGTSTGEETGLSNDNRAVWKDIQVKCNFATNRVVRYTDSAINDGEEGLVSSAGMSCGWKPFIAVQLICPESAFTDEYGNNPSPIWDSKFTTYFKDNL